MQEVSVGKSGKPLVHQKSDSPIIFRADQPSGGLQHSVYARVEICVLKTRSILLFKVFSDNFPFRRNSGESNADDNYPGQPISDQVDPFTENTAHDRKTDECFVVSMDKHCKKIIPFTLAHSGGLNDGFHFRLHRQEQ